MERLPAIAGWLWIKHGFSLFRRQPAELLMLFMLCWCIKLALSIVPVLGALVAFIIFIPAFSQAFMNACDDIEGSRRVLPRILFDVFRAPSIKRLIGLGTLHLLAIVLAVFIALTLDDGYLLQMFRDHANNPNAFATIQPGSPEETQLARATFAGIASYQLLTLPLWFAGPLIAWRDMSVGKALFFSFFSVLRSLKAIIVYALGWFVIGTTAGMTIDFILALLQIDSFNSAVAITMMFSTVLSIVNSCASYASYVQVFGTPERPQT